MISRKIELKYHYQNIVPSDSEEDYLQSRSNLISDLSGLIETNFLLYLSLEYKYDRGKFLMTTGEAELISLNGDGTRFKLEVISYQITNEGYLIDGRIDLLDLSFIVLMDNERIEAILSKDLQEQLKLLGFISLTVKFKDVLIGPLGEEYLEFIAFPLGLHFINEEN